MIRCGIQQQAHTNELYAAYLRWYVLCTHPYCTRTTQADDEEISRAPSLTDTFVHSKYYYFSLLINELIQLSVVDAERTRPPCERGDFVPADIDGA
jgi:hypothetical protein